MTAVAHRIKVKPYTGSDYSEIYPLARNYYNRVIASTRRQPYVRSTYFKKQKVFVELFWIHLHQKNRRERNERIKFFACGIELLRTTRLEPVIKLNPNKSGEFLYRFTGITATNEIFYIQVKENKRTRRKDFMSVFPAN